MTSVYLPPEIIKEELYAYMDLQSDLINCQFTSGI